MNLAGSQKNILVFIVAAAGILLLVFLYSRYRIPPDISEKKIQFTNQTEDTLDISRFAGNTIFLNFYASWCGPCMQEMPELQSSWEKFESNEENIQFIAVTDDSWEKIEAVEKQFSLSFPVYKIVGDLRSNGIYTIPTSYLIDESGKIKKKTTGMIDSEKWLISN